MFFFTPRYLKHAKLLHKGVTRFINYKRDILPQAKLDEITALRTSLEQAMRARDKERLAVLNDEINKACEKALPHVEHSDIGENVEVFFVAIVIALGIRSYIAQPFKIPTGSMQPTLYGLVANHTEQDVTPNLFVQCKDWVAGRSYYNVVAKRSGFLRSQEPVSEHSFLGFFAHCRLHFEDGGTQWIWAPMRQLITDPEGFNLGMDRYLNLPVKADGQNITPDAQVERRIQESKGTYVTQGQLLARGTLDTGDHVLVNKMIYNFRRPSRGEVFVFTTKNIRSPYMRVSVEEGSQHYIKRLVGVPGDRLEVKSPELWVNGKPAEEFGMKRVASMQGDYKGYGNFGFLSRGLVRELSNRENTREYWAMGDNSYNSSDSRYWGTVPERNLVGPGLFCYFPLGRNWGVIW
ncbi:MAG: signal peptidase I [Verrucomicrobia bacterium 12-59-8]|nr:MAG: signal peptidase I [Verrucomicrobia bacterium 12-59-8]